MIIIIKNMNNLIIILLLFLNNWCWYSEIKIVTDVYEGESVEFVRGQALYCAAWLFPRAGQASLPPAEYYTSLLTTQVNTKRRWRWFAGAGGGTSGTPSLVVVRFACVARSGRNFVRSRRERETSSVKESEGKERKSPVREGADCQSKGEQANRE